MKIEILKKAMALADQVGYVLVATADRRGLPHVASSRRIELRPDGRIAVSEWFCPGTLSNLQQNPKISLVVWEPATDIGFQMLGTTEGVEDLSMMDGFSPAAERKDLPQVERRILVKVDQLVRYSHAPHSDLEE